MTCEPIPTWTISDKDVAMLVFISDLHLSDGNPHHAGCHGQNHAKRRHHGEHAARGYEGAPGFGQQSGTAARLARRWSARLEGRPTSLG